MVMSQCILIWNCCLYAVFIIIHVSEREREDYIMNWVIPRASRALIPDLNSPYILNAGRIVSNCKSEYKHVISQTRRDDVSFGGVPACPLFVYSGNLSDRSLGKTYSSSAEVRKTFSVFCKMAAKDDQSVENIIGLSTFLPIFRQKWSIKLLAVMGKSSIDDVRTRYIRL
jgi:hypothetical protein